MMPKAAKATLKEGGRRKRSPSRSWAAVTAQGDDRDHGRDRERGHEEGGDGLHEAVAADHEEHGAGEAHEDRRLRDGEGQSGDGEDARHSPHHARHLEHERDVHEEPQPEHPGDAEARSRQPVEGGQRRAAVGHRVAPELDLHEHLQ
jgi:hypothetical protein